MQPHKLLSLKYQKRLYSKQMDFVSMSQHFSRQYPTLSNSHPKHRYPFARLLLLTCIIQKLLRKNNHCILTKPRFAFQKEWLALIARFYQWIKKCEVQNTTSCESLCFVLFLTRLCNTLRFNLLQTKFFILVLSWVLLNTSGSRSRKLCKSDWIQNKRLLLCATGL